MASATLFCASSSLPDWISVLACLMRLRASERTWRLSTRRFSELRTRLMADLVLGNGTSKFLLRSARRWLANGI